MTNKERNELKEQLDEVMREIEGLNLTLDKLRLKKESLQNRISGSKPQLVSTSIEYLFSRFDFELSEHFCSKATVTKAKHLLLDNGYTDLNQLKGKKLSDFFTLCEGIKILSVILAFSYSSCTYGNTAFSINRLMKVLFPTLTGPTTPK